MHHALLVILVLAHAPRAQQLSQAKAKKPQQLIELMEKLSRRFQETERGIAARKDTGEAVKALVVAAERLTTDARITASPATRRAAQTLRRRISGLNSKPLDRAARRVLLDSVRASCIACHVIARKDPAGFPATRNTIWGKVKVLRQDGTARANGADVAVFVDNIAKPELAGPSRIPPRVSQRAQAFHPRVLPVVVGTVVEFPNDSRVFHNVFSLSKTRPFDLGIYRAGQTRRVRFDCTGLVRIYCNIHPKMTANVLVLQNTCFAVTNRDGVFVITGVPDGNHRLRAWNEYGGSKSAQVQVKDKSTLRQDLEIRETKRTLTHKNKFSKRYRKKY